MKRNQSVIMFFMVVLALEWTVLPVLVRLSPMAVGLMAFIPALVAFLLTALAEGRRGAAALLRLSLAWRIPGKWYLVAILIPAAIHLLAAGIALVLGQPPDLRPGLFLAYLPLTLLLAVGEEIGWHGYALPRLRALFAPWQAVFVFGSLHAVFHLPMYLLPLPEQLRQASPFWLFLLLATSFASFRVWFFDRTRGNVPLAIVYHAAINTSVLLLNGVGRELVGALVPAVWTVAALMLLASGVLGERWQPEDRPVAV